VSNKTSEAGDESVDPLDPLLYSLFLANSSRLDQAQLSDILGVSREQLQLATALAVRLGFASKLGAAGNPQDDGLGGGGCHSGLSEYIECTSCTGHGLSQWPPVQYPFLHSAIPSPPVTVNLFVFLGASFVGWPEGLLNRHTSSALPY
jgi:hypothetical protein